MKPCCKCGNNDPSMWTISIKLRGKYKHKQRQCIVCRRRIDKERYNEKHRDPLSLVKDNCRWVGGVSYGQMTLLEKEIMLLHRLIKLTYSSRRRSAILSFEQALKFREQFKSNPEEILRQVFSIQYFNIPRKDYDKSRCSNLER